MLDVVAGRGWRPAAPAKARAPAAPPRCSGRSQRPPRRSRVRQAPRGVALGQKERSGAACTQWASRSVSLSGYGLRAPGERSSVAPSGRRSTITSASPSRTRRSGACARRKRLLRECLRRGGRHAATRARLSGRASPERPSAASSFFLALRDRRGKRLGGKPGGRVARAIRGNMWVTAKFVNGALPAIRSASSRRLGHAGAVLDQILQQADRLAFFALSVRPVSIMSIIRATPISGGSRTKPPPPTKMPRLPSGSASRPSVRPHGYRTAAASSSPPPTTAPCRTATTGTLPN